MEKMTIKERSARKLEDWKKDVNQLEKQLEHSLQDAKESFEDQKSNLAKWIDGVKTDLHKLEDFSEEKAEDLKAKLEALRVQAALGRAEAEDIFHDRQQQLNHAIHNVKISLAKMKKKATINSASFLDKAHFALDSYHTSFDMFRLQMNLGRKEATQKWQERKKDITLRINKMKTQINQLQEKSSTRWEHFSEEMTEAWSHVKDALK